MCPSLVEELQQQSFAPFTTEGPGFRGARQIRAVHNGTQEKHTVLVPKLTDVKLAMLIPLGFDQRAEIVEELEVPCHVRVHDHFDDHAP